MQISQQINKLIVYEYLLLIEPRKDLSERITDIKKQFFEKYKAPEAIRGKPHITLVNFVQYNTYEERICQRLRTLSLSKAPFLVELLDFGSFPSHTIFINVISRPAVENLVKNIRTEMQGLIKLNNDNRPHFILQPHLTIARKLKPWQYEEGWLQYRHKNFSGKFIANNMILLRRDFEGGRYQLVERFEFQDLPVVAKQAMLF